MNLSELAEKHNTDKLWHGYMPHYEAHFGPLQGKPIKLIEIGVASGASMRVWNDWFTNFHAEFLGIDIEPETPTKFDNRTLIMIADGTALDWRGPKVDIIVDDGSHTSDDIVAAFGNWWPHLKSGGWYVIEDLAVQVRQDYGGTPMGSSVTSFLCHVIQEIMLGHAGDNRFGIDEVHVYDEIVFLRKS